MRSFFLHRDYPPAVVDRSLQRVNAISLDAAMRPPENDSNKRIIPLILTFNPISRRVKKILSTNFELLRSDPEFKEIFDNLRVLGAFRRDTNLKDSLVRSNLQNRR